MSETGTAQHVKKKLVWKQWLLKRSVPQVTLRHITHYSSQDVEMLQTYIRFV
jgi:hypothetical protein